MAEYYCPLKVNSSVVRKGNSQLPERTMKWTKAGMVNDLRMHSLLKMNAASGNLIMKLVEAENIDGNGYAARLGTGALFGEQKARRVCAYMADISKYEPLDTATEPVPGKPDPLFVKHFGSDYEALERELQQYLTSKTMQAEYVDPIENETIYVVKCVQKMGLAFLNKTVATSSPAAAKKFKEEQEAVNKNSTFFTTVCKSRKEADRVLQTMK